MTWDVQTARKRIGLPDGDTSRDTDLQACMAVALGLAERYCDRRFMFKEGDTMAFRNAMGPALRVYRWPIEEVLSVTDPANTNVLTYVTDTDYGIVYLTGCWAGAHDAVIVWNGGYRTLPADLEWALWAVFDQLWSTGPGWGLPSSVSGDTGKVRSFAIDGMSLSYETSSGDATGTAGQGDSAWGIMPARAVAALDFYRAETAVGGA